MPYYVYLMANKNRTSLYTGITNNIERRVWEHKNRVDTNKYNCTKLVYCEEHNEVVEAIKREKTLKRWRRAWKDELVERDNPQWVGLAAYLDGDG